VTVALAHLDAQLDDLRSVYLQMQATAQSGGTVLIELPQVVLPAGWNQTHTTVYFVVPLGYPMAQPDCFWTDGALRLATGEMPINSGTNPLPSMEHRPTLWFSWHVSGWNPAHDDLLTYLRVIENRFKEVR
jgi:hypothetical protein